MQLDFDVEGFFAEPMGHMHSASIIIIVIYYLPAPGTCPAQHRPDGTRLLGRTVLPEPTDPRHPPSLLFLPRYQHHAPCPSLFSSAPTGPSCCSEAQPPFWWLEKTAVLLEDIRFLMHFLQTLISQTLLALDAGGLLKHAIN